MHLSQSKSIYCYDNYKLFLFLLNYHNAIGVGVLFIIFISVMTDLWSDNQKKKTKIMGGGWQPPRHPFGAAPDYIVVYQPKVLSVMTFDSGSMLYLHAFAFVVLFVTQLSMISANENSGQQRGHAWNLNGNYDIESAFNIIYFAPPNHYRCMI